jgi:hypothetical protein
MQREEDIEMKNKLLATGWVVALLIVLGAWTQLGELRDQLDQSGTRVERIVETSVDLANMQDKLYELKNELSKREKWALHLEKDKKTTTKEIEALKEELEKVETTVVGEESEVEDVEQSAEEAAREKEFERAQLETRSAVYTEMTYAKLFTDLQLPADLEADVTAILIERKVDEWLTARAAQKDGIPMSDLLADAKAIRDHAFDQISEILNEEEYGKVVTYDGSRAYHELNGEITAQLNQLSSGLSPENKEVVSQLSVDVLKQHQREYFQAGEKLDKSKFAESQLRAFDDIATQLGNQLDSQQMVEVNRWINIRKMQLKAMAKQ